MRFLTFFLTFITSVFAETFTIGAGPYFQTQPYQGAKTITIATPVVFFDNSIFYIRWSRAGVYFLGEKNEDYAWGFSLVAQPRPYGYKPNDATILEGMDKRNKAIEAGVAFSLKIEDAYLEIMALSDVTNHADAYIIKSELGFEYSLGNFTFYPSLLMVYQSRQFTNYYYGVKHSEVTSNRNLYIPKSGIDFGAQAYIEYPVTKNTLMLLNLRADKLSSQITSSPLVNDSYIYSGLASLLYKFSY